MFPAVLGEYRAEPQKPRPRGSRDRFAIRRRIRHDTFNPAGNMNPAEDLRGHNFGHKTRPNTVLYRGPSCREVVDGPTT